MVSLGNKVHAVKSQPETSDSYHLSKDTVCADIKEVHTFAFITIGTRKKLEPKCVDCYGGRASQLFPIACVPGNNLEVNLVLVSCF